MFCVLPLRNSVENEFVTGTISLQRFMSNIRCLRTSNDSLMISNTMTSSSIRRSLMRAKDEPITLEKKIRRLVCRRRQWVMLERRSPLFVVTKVTSKTTKFRDETKVSKSGLCWTDKGSKSSLIVKQRFEKTRIPDKLRQKKYLKVEWNKWSSRNKAICRLHQGDERRWQDHQFFHKQFSKQNWDLREFHDERFRWKNWSDFRIPHSTQLQNKIGRRSRYYSWTHRQDTGITEWNQLYERFDSFFNWRNAQPFCRKVESQKWIVKHLGHAWNFGKHFCKSSRVLFIISYAEVGVPKKKADPFINSQKFSHLQWRRFGQTNNDCRFNIFIETNSPYQ